MTIFNPKQYQITKDAVVKFKEAIRDLEDMPAGDTPTALRQAELAGMRSIVEEMEDDLATWEGLIGPEGNREP
jgi:hypothetical protein